MTAHIAVLGTGKMGSAIARRLVDLDPGIALWNRTPERAQQLHLGRVAPTAAEAVLGADVVISCLTGPAAIRAAYLSRGGALEARQAAVYVEMSTAGDAAAELAPLVEQAGGRLVEAPILGAPTLVAAGRAAVLVGGDGADVDRVAPILGRLGEVHRVGPLGSASRLKLVANSMLATSWWPPPSCRSPGKTPGSIPRRSSGPSRGWRPSSNPAVRATSRTGTSRPCSPSATCARTWTWRSACSADRPAHSR